MERHIELCAQRADYHNARYWDSVCFDDFQTERLPILIPIDLLESVYRTSFRIFDLRPGVQNVSCS
jgi:hypothetical protein